MKQTDIIANNKNIVSKSAKVEIKEKPTNKKIDEGLAKTAVANFLNKQPLTKK